MTDKYDEFKEWIAKVEKESIILQNMNWEKLFETFEEYYKEKHQKKEIINTIWNTLKENSVQLSYQIDGSRCTEHPAEAVYNKLKEKDLIK